MNDHERLWHRLQRVVRSLVRGALADDAVQEVWVRCTEKGLGPDTAFVVLKHMTIDVLRREHRHEGEELDGRTEPPVPEHGYTEVAQSVHEALDRAELSAWETTVVIRRYWWGETPLQIAMLTGASVDGVNETLTRALAKVGRVLAEGEGGADAR